MDHHHHHHHHHNQPLLVDDCDIPPIGKQRTMTTMATTTTTTTTPTESSSSSSEISVTMTIPQDGNSNNANNIPLALGMLTVGYILGAANTHNNSNSNSNNNNINHESSIIMALPQLVDSVIAPILLVMAIMYLIARLTVLRGAFLAVKPMPKKQKSAAVVPSTTTTATSTATSRSMPSMEKPDVVIDDNAEIIVVNMTGSYQLVENDNFEALLACQGVPWALRCAANKLRPIHRFTHVQNTLTIKIEGIIETETSYEIGGPPVECEVRGRKFRDTMEYINGGVLTIKRAIADGYSVSVKRILSADKKTLTMTSTVTFDDETNSKKGPVTSVQRFEWIEPDTVCE